MPISIAPPSTSTPSCPDSSTRPADPAGLPPILTVHDLARLLRINRKTVYAEIAAGRIPGIRRFGSRRPVYRAHRDTVLTWLAGQHQQARPSRRPR